ncbi:MAG: hypothetical protein WCX83_02795, partial [Candidatus Cloacimonas sp.]|nr:hypothetical protein [Candidatus Cloacimonadota bacterium]
MKKVFLLALITVFTASFLLSMDINHYGSARTGVWYEMENEDWSGSGESELDFNSYFQGNSHFGVRLQEGNLSGKFEIGAGGSIRMLYGRLKMDGWSLFVGKDFSNIRMASKQVYGSDLFLIGWGALDEGLKSQVRFELDNGLYVSLMSPETFDAVLASQAKKALIPKANIGYKTKFGDNIDFHGSVGVNYYNYDKNYGPIEEAVLAYVAGVLFDFDLDPMAIRLHANFGQNTGNYGITSVNLNRAVYNAVKDEIENVTTLGGFGDFAYKMSDKAQVVAGVGFTSADYEGYDNADTAMAFY